MSDIKTVTQIRKAIMPLVELMKAEADKEFTHRLDAIEDNLAILAKRSTNVTVEAPEVHVDIPQSLTESLSKLSKAQTPTPVSSVTKYEPHDQSGGAIKYNGFVAEDGSWYIQRLSKNQQRYAKGKGDYSQAWDGKGKLNYGYISGEK